MRRLFLLALFLAGCSSATQPVIQPPSAFLEAGPRPKVMFPGTFHFADAGLDAYKPQHDINILEPRRQKDIEALVERLARFRPTKVAIEVRAEQDRVLVLIGAGHLSILLHAAQSSPEVDWVDVESVLR